MVLVHVEPVIVNVKRDKWQKKIITITLSKMANLLAILKTCTKRLKILEHSQPNPINMHGMQEFKTLKILELNRY